MSELAGMYATAKCSALSAFNYSKMCTFYHNLAIESGLGRAPETKTLTPGLEPKNKTCRNWT